MFWQVCTLPAKDAFHLSLSHFTNTSARASRTLTTVFLPVHKLRIWEDRRGVLVDGSTSVLVPNSTRTPVTSRNSEILLKSTFRGKILQSGQISLSEIFLSGCWPRMFLLSISGDVARYSWVTAPGRMVQACDEFASIHLMRVRVAVMYIWWAVYFHVSVCWTPLGAANITVCFANWKKVLTKQSVHWNLHGFSPIRNQICQRPLTSAGCHFLASMGSVYWLLASLCSIDPYESSFSTLWRFKVHMTRCSNFGAKKMRTGLCVMLKIPWGGLRLR